MSKVSCSRHSLPRPIIFGAIGGLSLLVAWVLRQTGWSRGLDGWASEWGRGLKLEGSLAEVPAGWVWGWAVLISVGLAWAILESDGWWRRMVLVVTSLVLTLSWVPVLGLVSMKAELSVPLVAWWWSGLWAWVYAVRHRELSGEEGGVGGEA